MKKMRKISTTKLWKVNGKLRKSLQLLFNERYAFTGPRTYQQFGPHVNFFNNTVSFENVRKFPDYSEYLITKMQQVCKFKMFHSSDCESSQKFRTGSSIK